MSLIQTIKNKFKEKTIHKKWPGLINAYRDWLPISDKTPVITLQEGSTPLIYLKSINNPILYTIRDTILSY